MGELERWKYCPSCRAELEVDDEKAECGACGFRTYAASKPTVCALVTDDQGRLLLGRRAGEPYEGRWDLPGGYLSEGEEALDGLRRELKEETGLDVEPLEFFGVWTDRYSEDGTGPATLNLYWTARIAGGELEAQDDVTELRWFAPGELPARDEIAFANVPLVIESWRQQHA